MEEGRILPKSVRKPRIIFDKRFDFFNELNVGDSAQILCQLGVESVYLEMDENSNEMKHCRLTIESAKKVDNYRERI